MAIQVAEVRRRLHALLHDDTLVNEYIRQYGPKIDIKSIKAIKEFRAKTESYTGEEGSGEDPIYEVSMTCPVCATDVTFYDLRAKSQQISQNKFLVPVYQGVTGYRSVDYTLLGPAVCCRCLFASSDKKDFIRRSPAGDQKLKSQLISNVITALQEKVGERQAVLGPLANPEEFFRRPRTAQEALSAYRLCISRASVEAWYEQPYSMYKMGAYALRIAHIMKNAGLENTEAIKEALGYLEEAFRVSNCPSEEIEMQVIYLIVAVSLKLGDFSKAHSYLTVFTNLKNTRLAEMKEIANLNTVTIDKWNEKAKTLWEDREEADLFRDE